MKTKTEILTELNALRAEVEAWSDDVPERWEPEGGDWYVDPDGCVDHKGAVMTECSPPNPREFGIECQTEEEAEALRLRMYARNRVDAWLREHYEPGRYVVREFFPGKWASVGIPAAPGEITVSLCVADQCAKAINDGTLQLAPPGEE